MSPEEIRDALDAIGWSQRYVARRLGIDEARFRRMCNGAARITPELADWLSVLAAFHRQHLLPQNWRSLVE